MPSHQTINAMDDSTMTNSTGSNILVDWNFHPPTGTSAPINERGTRGKTGHAQAANARREKDMLPVRDVSVRKRVAFEPNALYRVVEHYSAFSPREMSSVWYQEAEFDDFRKDIKRSARAMAKGRQEGTEIVRSRSNPEFGSAAGRTRVYCYRGIEHLQSAQVLRARQKESQRVMEAVLTNQGLLPNHLAKISRRMSIDAAQRAIDAGIKDAEEVREYLSSMSISGSMGQRSDFARRASDSLLR